VNGSMTEVISPIHVYLKLRSFIWAEEGD